MIQLVSYNFSTVENPLSDGGNFTKLNDSVFVGTLKTISGNLCEPVATASTSGTFWSGNVVQSGGTWPADQYSEITLTSLNFSSNNSIVDLVVRSAGAATGTYYIAALQPGSSGTNSVIIFFAFVAGVQHTLQTYTSQTIAQGDLWRFSVAGNVLAILRNGSTIQTFTDTNNYVTAAGSPGFSLRAVSAITNTQTALWAAGANQAAAPTYNPSAGPYTGAQTVTLSSTTPGGTIYYTTDGTTPIHSSSSVANGGTVTVASSLTLKSFISVSGFADSSLQSEGYVITVPTTTFSPVAGSYGPSQTVTFNNTGSGLAGFAQYYTTDGSTPTTGSTLYTSPITVSTTETVKVLATATNCTNSAIASAAYTINGAVTASTFSPVAGSYTSTQSVTLSNADSALPGFAQYYTTDGSTPTTGSTLYTVPITVSATQTIKVLAVATNYSNSSIAVATYTITSSGAAWSPVDSRVNKPNNATFRTVNGAQIDDVQTSSNPAVPGTDSRVNKPVPCGTYPQNSRTPPPFKS